MKDAQARTGPARRRFVALLLVAGIVSFSSVACMPGGSGIEQVVALDSPSPLVQIRIMIRAGSAYDPPGKEGLAALTASALLDGSSGDPDAPLTKEMLAERTRKWGANARPGVFADKESVTFSLTVPSDVLASYVEEILTPLFTLPLFEEDEISRLRDEAITQLSGQLRYEALEMLGLEGIENLIHDGTSYGHTVTGSVQGVESITRDDVVRFYTTYFKPGRLILGVSTTDSTTLETLENSLAAIGNPPAGMDVEPLREPTIAPPEPVDGRELFIVGMPSSGATGVHVGFPLAVRRDDPDWWQLYVANIHFGTHRDSHGNLYNKIREERGYNYCNYSYVEHFAFRPFTLFPPFNTPRRYQNFTIWIRPVGHPYGHHILKAAVYELERLIDEGLTEAEVERSKNKARVLYLNLAENTSRLLEAKVDDAFYGMGTGYLAGYLDRIDAVTTDQVNEAIRRYLQTENLKMLIVTEPELADQLAADIAAGANARRKTGDDYQIPYAMEGGERVYQATPEQEEILERDAAWESFDLGLGTDRIFVVPVEELFETGRFRGGRSTS